MCKDSRIDDWIEYKEYQRIRKIIIRKGKKRYRIKLDSKIKQIVRFTVLILYKSKQMVL